jgi:class 3 adenylate cyclase
MLGGAQRRCHTSLVLATRTFLFADLRDYTRFVERHGDAAAKTLIADYRRIVRAEVAKHEGAEVKTEGDSFYVVFNTTGSAVTCAAAIFREAERYSRERPDRPLRIGIGIHAGEPLPHEGQYVGSAVIVAARLAQSAGAGELLVSEVVRQLVPRSLSLPMAERTGVTLKGLDDPPRIFAVDWQGAAPAAPGVARTPADTAIAAASPSSQQVLCPVVIGREREAEQLAAQLREASAGRGRTVLVSGEAGLGKSALLRRFVEHARAEGALVLSGECTEIEARRPFGPVIDALGAAGIPLPEALAQGGPGALPVAEVERYRVHVAFAERLGEAARERPVVLIIEDLHWADEATQELVPYLARKLRDARVLLLATYRSDELHRLHPLNHLLAELSRGRLADDIRLERLTLEQVGDVIRAALGLAGPATPEFRRALHERTEGNPFFVEEILRALVEKGELEYRDGAWHRTKAVAELAIPVSVRDAVQQRLITLEPRARKAMQVAAIIGQRFDFDLLGAVSGFDEASLLDAIRSAIDAQLVREETDAQGNEVYAFRHALSREAVLLELLQRERRMLHRSVGEAIERLAGAGDGPRVEELAYHFDEARDLARARRYHALAAERSLRLAAPQAAVRHLERAIELASDDDADLAGLLLRLCDAALVVADVPRALRAAEQARQLADAGGDRIAAGEAIHRIAHCRWYLGHTAQAREIGQEGVALLEPLGPSAALAACYAELARLAMIDAREDEAIELGRRAEAMAHAVGAREIEIASLVTVGSALGVTGGKTAEGVAMLRRGYELAEASGYSMEAERALNNIIAALSTSDATFSEIVAVHRESLEHAKKHGYRSEAFVGREVLMEYLGGEWDSALEHERAARNDGIWSAGREQNAATMLVAREGPRPEHLALAERATRRLVAAGDQQWLVVASTAATSSYLAGRWAETIARAEPAYAWVLHREGGTPVPIIQAAVLAAHAARRSGDRAAEDRWVAALRVGGRLRLDRAGVAFADALVARRDGRPDDAIALLREAIDLLRDRPQMLATLASQHELVELLVERGRPAEAATVFADLVAFWRRVKATWFVAQLEDWGRGLGLPVAA